jgi:hypothetical protein
MLRLWSNQTSRNKASKATTTLQLQATYLVTLSIMLSRVLAPGRFSGVQRVLHEFGGLQHIFGPTPVYPQHLLRHSDYDMVALLRLPRTILSCTAHGPMVKCWYRKPFLPT